MRKFLIVFVLFLFLGVRSYPQSSSEFNLEKIGKLQFEVNPSFFIFSSGSDFDFGPKINFSLRKDRLRIGISSDFSKRNIHFTEISIKESLSTISIKNEDRFIYGIFLFGEYSPFNFGKCNPYVNLQTGFYLGEFDPAFALSGGIGLEFILYLSDDYFLKPFIQTGYQKVVLNPIQRLNLNGLKSEIGLRFTI